MWICPRGAFQHSAIVSLMSHMKGQCLAELSNWQIHSLLSTIPGFVPFFRLSAVSPFIDIQHGHATVLKYSHVRISHIRAICPWKRSFLFHRLMPQEPLLNTGHECILGLSFGQF